MGRHNGSRGAAKSQSRLHLRPPLQEPDAMPRSEPSDCRPRSLAPATRLRSVHLWKPAPPLAPGVAEAALLPVVPARSVRRRKRAFRRPRRGGTGQTRGSSPLAEWVPFANILQQFRGEFRPFGCGSVMLWWTTHQPGSSAMSTKAVIRMPGEGKEITLAGQPMAFLVTGEDSKHTCMFDWTLPAGFSTGLHVHRVQEETFYVLEGECEWHVGGELIHAKPRTYVFIPPGVPHNIGNASDKPARMIMTVSPPGHEQYFEELVKLVTKSGPPDAAAIAKLRARFDTEQLSSLKAS